MGFYVFIVRGQCKDERKVLGGEKGARSAKDLKAEIELGSPWAQLRYMSMHHKDIGGEYIFVLVTGKD